MRVLLTVFIKEEESGDLFGQPAEVSAGSAVVRHGPSVVLASQQTATKRAIDGGSIAFGEVWCKIGFNLLSGKHVVDALFSNRANEAVGVTIVEGELDLVGGPVTGGPIKGFAIFDDLVEASTNLLNRRVRIPYV